MNTYIFSFCSAVYATLSALIAIQSRQRTNLLLSACCGVSAIWAASGIVWPQATISGVVGVVDLIRLLAWYFYLINLYSRSGASSRWQTWGFSVIAVVAFGAGVVATISNGETLSYTLLSPPIASRLMICVCELLLIENLYLNLPVSARWHVAVPCVLLGALACFDIVLIADTSLFRRPSIPLATARAIVMIIVAPLLVLAAFRGQRWNEPVRLSRTAVFHSATLVLSGSVLLALALTGEALRHFDETWGWVAELSLVFSGLVSILLLLSSRSAKSFLDQLVVHHFFADRYDYRVQWLRCIGTLSGKGSNELSDLYTRAIRAVADIVNSPSGTLFLREPDTNAMTWASSWNMPVSTRFESTHSLISRMVSERRVIELSQVTLDGSESSQLSQLGPTWLSVPLAHSSGVIGFVIVGPPRISFRLDVEVYDLLEIIGQEVATYIIEYQAAQLLAETRNLHDYGKRFSFVAHDVKNVSSQLALLIKNAEVHLDNPEFQQDMIETVQASVNKINSLLKRLDQPMTHLTRMSISPIPQIQLLLATLQRENHVPVTLKHDDKTAMIEINPEAFDDAVTHLLNNAIEAAPTQAVQIEVEHGVEHITIRIIDRGEGMSPEFVRDELFSLFKTKRDGGSGIGAFQARELITDAGGKLSVRSHKGFGTTMQISFPRAGKLDSVAVRQNLSGASGG